jgi:LysM repeat protein
MGRFRSTQSNARRLAPITSAVCAAIALAGCIDPATNAATDTTLVPLVAPTYVTLPPVTSTTVPAGEATTTTAPPNVSATTVITVVPPSTDTGSTPPSTASTPSSAAGSPSGDGSYTVTANDTVYGIARKHGISADALAKLNGWSDGSAHAIYPGDKVSVPDAATATTTAGSSGATTTSAASASTVAAGSAGTYVVVEGDYLSLIAKKTGTTAGRTALTT